MVDPALPDKKHTVYENVMHGDSQGDNNQRGFLVLRTKTLVYYSHDPEDVAFGDIYPMEVVKLSWKSISKHNISKASSPLHHLILYCKDATITRQKTDHSNPYAIVFLMPSREDLEQIEEDISTRRLVDLCNEHSATASCLLASSPLLCHRCGGARVGHGDAPPPPAEMHV